MTDLIVERKMSYSEAGGAIARDGEQPSIHRSSLSQPVRGVPKTISFDSSTESIGSSHTSDSHLRLLDSPTNGYSQRHEPVRGLSRSKSYEPDDPFTRNLERSRNKPDLVRGVARSKSYEASPYNERRCSRRPTAQPVRQVSRSKSYDEHHERCSTRDRHHRPEPVRGMPRSISYESFNPMEDPRTRHSAHERNSFVNSRHSNRPSELSNSLHSFQSAGTASSYEEFATEYGEPQPKRGSKRTSVKNKEKETRDPKVETVNDGQMDAYKAMVSASERTRKKKLNATSYVKITLANGMAGYVKSVQQ